MNFFSSQLMVLMGSLMLVSVILMHLSKKNFTFIILYALQSLVVAVALFSASFKTMSFVLMGVASLTLALKVIIIPYFFSKLIKRHQIHFSVNAYLNIPLTLVSLAILTALPYTRLFKALSLLSPLNSDALSLTVAAILISVFLIINRKGALSQMFGVLALENGIVSFAFISGLEVSASLQAGILFDISIWIAIAAVFITMIYQHFGSLEVTEMKSLKEE